MDWKKEYRASDAFRRRKATPEPSATPAEGAQPAPPELPAELGPAGDPEDTSVWKKEIKVSGVFRRGKKQARPEPAVSEPVTVESTGASQAEPADGTPTEPVAAGPAPPEFEPEFEPEPVATEAPATGAAQSSAWKKEIKVSSLFRRRTKPPEEPAFVEIVAEEPADVSAEPFEAEAPETEPVADAPEPVADPPQPAVSEPVTVESTGASQAEPADGTPTEPVAAGPAPLEPAPEPVATEAPATGAAQSSAWKKEIKVSSLFRRRTKPPEEPAFVEIVAEEPADVSAEPFEAEAPETEPVADAPEPVADPPQPAVSEPVTVESTGASQAEPADGTPTEPVAAGPAPLEPAPEPAPEPVATEAPATGAAQPSAWKKEIKVSSLFRRRTKPPEEPAFVEIVAEEPADVSAEPFEAEAPETEPVADAPEPVADPPQPAVSEPVTVESTGASQAEPADGTPTEPVAAGPAPPEFEPEFEPEPVATEAPATGAAQSSAWKKEIKVSSLFRRRTKPPEEPAFVEIVAEEPADVSAEPFEAEAPETEPVADAPEPVADPPQPAVSEPVTVESTGASQAEPADGTPTEPVAAGPAPPEFEPEFEPEVALQESIWKKEMKVSGLFRRKKDAEGPEQPKSVEAGPASPESEPAQDAPVPTSVWKKEIRLAPRRGRGPDKSVAREKPSRLGKRGRPGSDRVARSEARGSKSTGSLPDVPLVRALNLLPREEAKTRSARRPTLVAAAVTLAGLLVIGGLGYSFVRERSRVDDRAGALEDLEAQVAAIQAPAQVAPEAGTQLAGEALARAGALTTALDGRFVWDRLLRKLSLVLPDEVWFETVSSPVSVPTIDPATGLSIPGATATITINGYAKTQAGLAQLVGRLDVLPELGSVQLQSGVVTERGGEDVVQFTVAATLERPSEA